jgi:crotonobetainyl-CoA:carnitine CoA-transferase CaiB-like acyl-CoA transferase
MVMADLPLRGLRIIAVEQYGAGPFGSMYLADMGAEVIKIEPPGGGDVSRATGPHFLGQGDSQFFQTFNLNKRSVQLDLKHPAGQGIFHRLVRSADAVMNNLRGDQPAKLGLEFSTLQSFNPKIVCAHLSAYGRGNQRESWPGYDYLMQAEAGFMSLTGEPDAPPARFGLSMVDYMTGVTTAFALLARVFGAHRSGMGGDVDVSLFDVAIHQLSYPATWYMNSAQITERIERSAHPATVPCQLYKTKDGWILVMAMTAKFWELLCDGLGRSELKADARFVDFVARRAARRELTQVLDEQFMQNETAHWLHVFQGKIPIAPVNNLASALENEFLQARGLQQTITHSQGPIRVLSNPILLDGQRIDAHVCPALGADTASVMRELGYSDLDVQSFRESGVL